MYLLSKHPSILTIPHLKDQTKIIFFYYWVIHLAFFVFFCYFHISSYLVYWILFFLRIHFKLAFQVLYYSIQLFSFAPILIILLFCHYSRLPLFLYSSILSIFSFSSISLFFSFIILFASKLFIILFCQYSPLTLYSLFFYSFIILVAFISVIFYSVIILVSLYFFILLFCHSSPFPLYSLFSSYNLTKITSIFFSNFVTAYHDFSRVSRLRVCVCMCLYTCMYL